MRNPTEENFWARNSTPKAKAKLKRLAKQFDADERSIRIIFGRTRNFDEYEGWPDDSGAIIPEDEIQHLIDQGWIPDESVYSDQEPFGWLLKEKAQISKESVASNFIAGLSNKRFDLHSTLGSFAMFAALNLENRHDFPKFEGFNEWTLKEKISTEYLLQWAHHRLNSQYGGHDGVVYAAYDFWKFNQTPSVKATNSDKQILRDSLNAIRSLPENAKLTQLNQSLSGIVKGNKSDRQHILEILGYCGILGTPDGISMRERYVSRNKEPMPNHFFSKEWHFPASFWNGTVGVDEAEVAFWFPGFEK